MHDWEAVLGSYDQEGQKKKKGIVDHMRFIFAKLFLKKMSRGSLFFMLMDAALPE
jgi:hypothetical protein